MYHFTSKYMKLHVYTDTLHVAMQDIFEDVKRPSLLAKNRHSSVPSLTYAVTAHLMAKIFCKRHKIFIAIYK